MSQKDDCEDFSSWIAEYNEYKKQKRVDSRIQETKSEAHDRFVISGDDDKSIEYDDDDDDNNDGGDGDDITTPSDNDSNSQSDGISYKWKKRSSDEELKVLAYSETFEEISSACKCLKGNI